MAFDCSRHFADNSSENSSGFLERREHAGEQTDGNITNAARLLGLSFRSLRYKVKKLGIER